MTISLISHVALRAANLREAERYYRYLLGLEVAFREAETAEGWRRLPEGKSWDDAEAAAVQLGMVMLYRDGLALAIEQGAAVNEAGNLSHIGLLVDQAELSRLRRDLAGFECQIVHDFEQTIVFDDKYGVRWEPSLVEYAQPKLVGIRTAKWLEI